MHLLLLLACRNDKDSLETGDPVADDTADTAPDCVPEEESCNGVDDDCDGEVDEEGGSTWYADADGDGYGDQGASTVACEAPEGTVAQAGDCDDEDAAVHPGADELCNFADDDCDGDQDEDAIDTQTFWSDADHDGYGFGEGFEECNQPPDTATQGGDCDDEDADAYPGAQETWYDGVDSDCGGDDDYDADGDGSRSSDHGGEDCQDQDPSVTACRPDAGCVHPDAATIQAAQVNGSTDLAFDSDCSVWVPGIRSGTDYTYRVEPDGTVTVVTGYSNYNQQAIAIDPATGDIVVAHNANSQGSTGMGWAASGTTSLNNFTGALFINNTIWTNSFMNRSPGALAWDSSGCIWTPNFQTEGTLSCVLTDGTYTDVYAGGALIQTVALDSSEQVYVGVGAEVLLVDTGAGTASLVHTAGADILDIVFDPWNDDLYVETTAGEIERVTTSGSSVAYTVTGQGRLAISPDGWLVRLVGNPTATGTFEEWELPAW